MPANLARRHVVQIVGRKADTPNAGNFLLRMIRLLMAHPIEVGIRDDNPAQNVTKYVTDRGGFHTWDEGEIADYYRKHEAGTTAHTAFSLMLFTGAARVDACHLGWQHPCDGRLRYRRKKTERTTAALIDIPVHPELAAVLDTLPRDRQTFLQTNRAAARSPNGGMSCAPGATRPACLSAPRTGCARPAPGGSPRRGQPRTRSLQSPGTPP
jgi:hypothetical protein